MGKAARRKQDRKVKGYIEGMKALDFPIAPGPLELFRTVMLDAICDSIGLDNFNEMYARIDVFEAQLGESIFDAKIITDLPDGSQVSTGILLFAAAMHSCECASGLLRFASNCKHEEASIFVAFAMQKMQELPPSDQGHKTLVRVIEGYLEPVDINDARGILETAGNSTLPPVMSELVRRISLRYIAENERKDLIAEIGEADLSSRVSLRM